MSEDDSPPQTSTGREYSSVKVTVAALVAAVSTEATDGADLNMCPI